MKGFLVSILLIYGKKIFGGVYKKAIVLLIMLGAYIALGITLKLMWKSFKKKYIPFLGKK